MKDLKQHISQWEAELKKHNLDLKVLEIFVIMSKLLINQKRYINELGDMVENSGLRRLEKGIKDGRL
ncbi:hypothetical protein [Halobacillus sp. B29]|uniref:hypothetical protein n=1 Tax=Halobacillus sp. B29 TaxID=3457432 RepID=UPI003FCD0F97